MPSLSNIFTQENISKLLQDEEVKKDLIPELPDGQKSEEYLQDNLSSV